MRFNNRQLTQIFKDENEQKRYEHNRRNSHALTHRKKLEEKKSSMNEKHCARYTNNEFHRQIRNTHIQTKSLGEEMLDQFCRDAQASLKDLQYGQSYFATFHKTISDIIIAKLDDIFESYHIFSHIQIRNPSLDNQGLAQETSRSLSPNEGDQNEQKRQGLQQGKYRYMKSPDFVHKKRLLQRMVTKTWLGSRGKERKEWMPRSARQPHRQYQQPIALNQGLNINRVLDPSYYNTKQRVIQDDTNLNKCSQTSYDKQNEEIVHFCMRLFQNWLSDYEAYVERAKDRNVAHNSYILNEGMRKNLRDQCLPIDYFIERMLQIGLCYNMDQIKDLLASMWHFDRNVGFQQFKKDSQPGEEDLYKPINYHNKFTNWYIRKHLDKCQFQQSDRVSLTQFLSLFNVFGVNNGKRIEILVKVLEKQQSIGQQLQSIQIRSGLSSQKQSADDESVADQREKRIRQQQQRAEHIKTLKDAVSPKMRRTIGAAASMFQKRELVEHVDFTELELLQSNIQDSQFQQAHQKAQFTARKDERYYQEVMEIFRNVQIAATYLNKFAKLRRVSRSDGKPFQGLTKDTIVDQINESIEQRNLSGCKCVDPIKFMSKNNFFQDLFGHRVEDKALDMMLPKVRRARLRMREGEILGKVQTILLKTISMDGKDRQLAGERREYERSKQDYREIRIKEELNYQKLLQRIQNVRKQMILGEVCKDIIEVNRIMAGLVKCDRLHTLSKGEQAERQVFRKQFTEYIVHQIRQRYSSQAYVLYELDESHPKPEEYQIQAIEARSILLQISVLMMRNNIQLRYDEHEKWLGELAKVEQIRILVNRLVNIVSDQMVERERAMKYPNESIAQLIEQGSKTWHQYIDRDSLFLVPRHTIDQFLIQNGVLDNYKEVSQFLGGVLNTNPRNANALIRKSDFMALVYKGALRKSVINIMNHCKVGNDTDPERETLSLKVQRLQRQILYSGILTKNINSQDLIDENGTLSNLDDNVLSDSCRDIITCLQFLKQDKRINLDKCKIILENNKERLAKYGRKLTKRVGVMSDFQHQRPAAEISEESSCCSGIDETFQELLKNQQARKKHDEALEKGKLLASLLDKDHVVAEEAPRHHAHHVEPATISKFASAQKLRDERRQSKQAPIPVPMEGLILSSYHPKRVPQASKLKPAFTQRTQRKQTLIERQQENLDIHKALARAAIASQERAGEGEAGRRRASQCAAHPQRPRP